MENKNKPVFPVEVSTDENGNLRGSKTSTFSGMEMGITKREYFTAKAMQGLLSNPEWMKEFEGQKYLMQDEVIAKVAINIADVVLAKIAQE
jgi:hypothetical protein